MVESASDRSVVASISCANSHYAYPNLVCKELIPAETFAVLDPIWSKSTHEGLDVRFFRFQNVFIAKEGLVFHPNGKLIDVTKTYHVDQDVVDASQDVLSAIAASGFATVSRGILAKSRGSSNFGHFIVEMLSRAWMARRHLSLADWPAIIDAVSPATRAISEQALIQAGFAPDQIIALGPEPTFIEELIVVDGLSLHSRYLSPFVMQALDNLAASIPAASDRLIYTPRRPSTARDFEDESGVAQALAELGFKETPTAEMTFVEQVSAFKGAKHIVAVSGAALTNICFCRPGTKITSFMPASAFEVMFWMIAESRRLDYQEIRCEETGPPTGILSWDRKLRVSPAELKLYL